MLVRFKNAIFDLEKEERTENQQKVGGYELHPLLDKDPF